MFSEVIINSNYYNLLLIIASVHLAFAIPPDWRDDPGAYQFVATIAGVLVMNEGVQMGGDGDILAAFDDVGNVRGRLVEELINDMRKQGG